MPGREGSEGNPVPEDEPRENGGGGGGGGKSNEDPPNDGGGGGGGSRLDKFTPEEGVY